MSWHTRAQTHTRTHTNIPQTYMYSTYTLYRCDVYHRTARWRVAIEHTHTHTHTLTHTRARWLHWVTRSRTHARTLRLRHRCSPAPHEVTTDGQLLLLRLRLLMLLHADASAAPQSHERRTTPRRHEEQITRSDSTPPQCHERMLPMLFRGRICCAECACSRVRASRGPDACVRARARKNRQPVCVCWCAGESERERDQERWGVVMIMKRANAVSERALIRSANSSQ